ncbi:DUF302 domain-containing protein [Sulfuricurvum sp.]|uniref:DUF302 domain-containing protein n=1 Tax=Sulfuricurvum sp. TaxID=2025608 RepID=UPI0026324149|nr:DUF302 domain-containing protein [Sulfuricurvum sp.]MDD2266759.1 DUF302 domain-containing protein [Sulfuricurvum sp.]MDD2784582.1 DUF302 domain-containing protein [Sulfuricurvum sp.]
MQTKIIVLFCLVFAGVLNAETIRIETPEFISYRVSDISFEELQLRIGNELQVNGFNIVYEINIAKALEAVSKNLDQQSKLHNGISIGFCKPSVSYQLMNKSIDTLLYCPLKLVVFQVKENSEVTVSFLKAPKLNDQVDPKSMDAIIEKIITSALD